jgi:hypothetical protein
MNPMLFGALVFEREPMQMKDLVVYVLEWIQVAGGYAAAGVYFWLLIRWPRIHPTDRAAIPVWRKILFSACIAIAAAAYLTGGYCYFYDQLSGANPSLRFQLAAGGVASLALFLGSLPFLNYFLAGGGSRRGLAYICLLLLFVGLFGIALTALWSFDYLILRPRTQIAAPSITLLKIYIISFLLGGVFSLVAVLTPFVSNMVLMRFRRIFAIAILSFKEAVRRRILYAFGLILLIFLFAAWFVQSKAEDQVRTYVTLVSLAMAVLLLFAAVVLASFSIPADMRQQTIHTIVTKPVQRFEIVLGRFLGFTALMTVVLAVMSALCLLYILREIDPEAARESLKARAPFYGDLHFENTTSKTRGDSVGTEWEYRGYIGAPFGGQQTAPQTAVWIFPQPSASVGHRTQVPCEFTFAVYRTTKGKEYQGVDCRFVFTTWHAPPNARDEFQKRQAQKQAFRAMPREGIEEQLKKDVLLQNDPDKLRKRLDEELADKERAPEEVLNKLCEELGCFIANPLVTNAHLQIIQVPGGLLKNAALSGPHADRAPLLVEVTCQSPTQYVGMARYDLYFRLDESSQRADRFWFALNFFKGVAGLWFRLWIIIGLAVALSTYLSGVISLLIAVLLFLGGESRDFIQSIGVGGNPGGGPVESLIRVVTRQNMITPLEETAVKNVIAPTDFMFRFLIRRVLDVVPDTQRLIFRPYVAEGFDIGWDQLFMAFLLTTGYLLPWAVLAFYLIRWREIAGDT